MNEQIFNKSNVDMASALTALPTFEGKKHDDIIRWLKQASMIAKMTILNDLERMRLIFLRLKGNAQIWASQLLTNSPNIGLEDFENKSVARFCSSGKIQNTLETFLACKQPQSLDDYIALLRNAPDIYEKNCIAALSLVKMVIKRSPDMIKSILYMHSLKAQDWHEFSKKAEDCAWLGFDSKKKIKDL
jgi:hypothetical protein